MNGKATWVRVSWMAGALLPLVAGLTSAANLNPTPSQTYQPNQQDQQVAPSSEQTPVYQPQLERAKNLIGAKVVNDRGEQLGKIEDVVLTPDRSAINYVVLSHGGTLGMGDKYFAVPWSKFSLQTAENERLFVLKGVSVADLDRAAGFDKNHWPATASDNWLGMTPSAGAAAPAPTDQGTMAPQSQTYAAPGASGMTPDNRAMPSTDIQHLRLSKILGTRVQDLQGEHLGRVDNVMVDLRSGKLAYGIIAMRHGFLGMNRDFTAVPWKAIDLTSQPGIAKVNADRDTLTAFAFGQGNFPNLADPQYSRQLFDRFHVTPYWESPSPSLGYIPSEENKDINKDVNPPSGMETPNSSAGMTAPNSNAAPVEMIAHKIHTDKHVSAYNPSAVETIHGKVRHVGSYRMEGTSVHGVLLTIRTDDGRTVKAQLGPRSWLDRQNVAFRPGDVVTVTGSVVKAGRHQTVIASQIRTPSNTIDLRTPEGRPLWSLDQYGRASTYDRGYSYGY